jgi:hypothetical protein
MTLPRFDPRMFGTHFGNIDLADLLSMCEVTSIFCVGRCEINQRDNFMFHVAVSSPYPVAIRVVKLYEAEAVTVAWGRVNSVCVCPSIC